MTRLIIDTDVALGVWHEGRPRDIDDGFAIVEALNNPSIELVGITCVYGNGPLDEVVRVAREIVTLKDSDVPVLRGAAEPLANTPPDNEAVAFLADRLREGPHAIAAIGPLTNIALLIRDHPDVVGNIESLVMVAGRTAGRDFYIGDAGPVRDFNFENDVEAAEIIMQAGVPCVLMGFELTSQVCVTATDLQQIAERGIREQNPTATYFHENSLAWCNYWTETFPVDAGFHPWDSAAIAWFVNRDWFVHEQRGHRISQDPKRFDTDPAFDGPQHTYCTGFSDWGPDGGKAAFVQAVIDYVY